MKSSRSRSVFSREKPSDKKSNLIISKSYEAPQPQLAFFSSASPIKPGANIDTVKQVCALSFALLKQQSADVSDIITQFRNYYYFLPKDEKEKLDAHVITIGPNDETLAFEDAVKQLLLRGYFSNLHTVEIVS